MVHRYYNPTTANFTTIDPLLAITGDPYSYAGDNPTNGGDPTGLCGWICITAIVVAAVVVVAAVAVVSVATFGGADVALGGAAAGVLGGAGSVAATAGPEIDQAVTEDGGPAADTASEATSGGSSAVSNIVNSQSCQEDEGGGSDLQQTIHGAMRAADPSRLDTEAQLGVISNATQTYTQANGAQVYIQEVGGKFNVVIQGNSGVISNLKTISQSSLNRLASNYGWKPN